MEIHDDQLSLSVFLSRSAIKSYIVPSLVWRKCVLKVTVLIFFLALQSIAAFCHMLGVWCVSAVQKKQERKNRSPVDSEQVWDSRKTKRRGGGGGRGCVSVFEWKSQTRSLSQDRLTGPASLMIIKLHISAKKRQSSLPCLCPRPVCPQEETDESWTLLFYCKMTHSKVQ